MRAVLAALLALSLALRMTASAGASPPPPAGASASSGVTFERDVLPILTANCLGCHGGLRQKAGLDLRSIPLMLKGGESGPAVKPGDPAASLVWTSVADDDMPKEKPALSPAEKATIRAWVAAGLPTVADRRPASDADPLLPASGAAHPARDVAAAIDRHVDRGLAEAGLAAAPAADDAEFLRRAYLDLTGRVPTAEQAAAFLDDAAPDKRAKLIDALLASPQFGEQFGRTWRDWIAPPELPSDPNGGKQPHRETQDLGKWIGERVAAGDGWDKIVRRMAGAEGQYKDNPGVLFLGLQGEGGKLNPAGSARGVASLFMGVQLQCAQCHDDPYRTWAQDDFWALAAFFKKADGDFTRVHETPPPPSPNKDPKKAAEQQKNYEAALAKARAAEQASLGAITIPKSAFLNAGKAVRMGFPGGPRHAPRSPDESYRAALLDWMTAKDNPYFARAFANRTWFYFFNRGIVHPVDDMRDLNPPTHPGLLALLAQEFAASGYDVKHVARAICNSRAYQRTSRTAPGASDVDAARLVASFGQMPLRVMTADVLYDSLRLAYGDPKLDLRPIDPKDGNTNGESAAVGDAYVEFQRAFCTNEDDQADYTHGIPQLLTTLNHPRLTAGSKALDEYLKVKSTDGPKKQKGKGQPSPQQPARSPAETVDWLYLSTLSRRPTDAERAEAIQYVAGAPDPVAGYVGVLWALVNRSEFYFVR